MHLHDGASEIFYFLAGRCRLQVGDTDEYFSPGDFVLVPPEVPHNLWSAADEDLLVFWIVAPHMPDNKWRTGEISQQEMKRRVIRSRVEQGAVLPGDDNIQSRLYTLKLGEGLSRETRAGQEAVIYIASGEADVGVGKLSGKLVENEFVHVPVNTPFSVRALDGAVSVLLFEMPRVE